MVTKLLNLCVIYKKIRQIDKNGDEKKNCLECLEMGLTYMGLHFFHLCKLPKSLCNFCAIRFSENGLTKEKKLVGQCMWCYGLLRRPLKRGRTASKLVFVNLNEECWRFNSSQLIKLLKLVVMIFWLVYNDYNLCSSGHSEIKLFVDFVQIIQLPIVFSKHSNYLLTVSNFIMFEPVLNTRQSHSFQKVWSKVHGYKRNI